MTRHPPGSSGLQKCPVIRAARRWVVSPLDFCVHLLPEGDHLPGGLTARCGHQPPTAVHQLDQPPPGVPCRAPTDLACGLRFAGADRGDRGVRQGRSLAAASASSSWQRRPY
jgi:hypothetical protein